MAKVREIPWPEEFQDLKRIEEFMICGICYDYMDTSVMTPCSHNYCSVCIRKYLHYKTQCPACFHDFFEKDLYINRAMDGLISHYLQVREKILSLIENRSVYNSVKRLEQEQPGTPPVRPVRSSQLPRSPKTVVPTKVTTVEKKLSDPVVPDSFSSPVASSSKSSVSSPSTSKSPMVPLPSLAKIFSTPKRKETAAPVLPAASAKTVACPVCSVNISEQHVNVHLDACLGRENNQKVVKKKQPRRPPLPKLVLHVMKEPELRRKMKEFGLSTIGDRRTLESRFTRYSVIYNAECDKPEPRPTAELIRQCEMEERQERKLDTFLVAKNTENRLHIEKNAKEEKIDEAQKNYRVTNKSSFDKLIEEVKNRRKMEKEKKEREAARLGDNESAGTSSKASTSENNSVKSVDVGSESGDENAAYVPSAEVAFNDSDSENECPLQLYRSDNTVKSIAVNLDDSSSCASISTTPVKRPQKSRGRAVTRSKTLTSLETKSNNVYEMDTDGTDDSMDEGVLSSPVTKKKQNPKRVKLSAKSTNKSLALASPKVATKNDGNGEDDPDYMDEQDIKEAEARDVCNSIIKDFSFDSDDSASEFADKRQNDMTKNVEKAKIETTQKKSTTSDLNQSKPAEKSSSISDQKEIRENIARVTVNDINVRLCDIPAEIFSEDDFCGFENASLNNAKPARVQKLNDIAEEEPLGKENSALTANGNDQPSALANENPINRPTRKRNVPLRFAEKTPTRRVTRAKTPTVNAATANDLHDEYADDLSRANSEGGSLKRRRGRQKPTAEDQPPLDEMQNPPKRPVRRRQVASDRASC